MKESSAKGDVAPNEARRQEIFVDSKERKEEKQ
jgi:hypothetical protein